MEAQHALFQELDNDCCSALAYNLGSQRGRVGPSPLRRRHLLGLRLLSELRLQGRTHTTAAGITQIIMSMIMRHIHTTVPITEAAIISSKLASPLLALTAHPSQQQQLG